MKHSLSIAALAVCLCLLFAQTGLAQNPTVQGAVVLNTSEGEVLVGGDGQLITPRGTYVGIDYLVVDKEKSEANLFVGYALVDGESICTILNAQGEPLSHAQYDVVYAENGVIYALKDDLTGALHASLEEWVPIQYTQLVANGEGGFLALNSDPYDARPDGVYYIDETGAERAAGVKVMFGLPGFSEGFMPVVSDNGRMGYLNTHGEWAISAQYDYAGEFQGDMAEAVINTGAGLIDKKGNWQVTPKYAQIELGGGDGGMVLVQEDNTRVQLLDSDTYAVKQSFTGDDIYVSACFDEDMAVLYLDDCTQLIDQNGRVIFESGLDAGFDVWSAMGDRIVVRQGAWGTKSIWLYTLGGERVAGPYRELWVLGRVEDQVLFAAADYSVSEEVDVDAAYTNYVEEPNSRSIEVIDQDGQVVIESRAYMDLQLDASGFLVFQSADQVGVLDTDGRIIAAFDKAMESAESAD